MRAPMGWTAPDVKLDAVRNRPQKSVRRTSWGFSMSDVQWWRGAVIYQIYPRSILDDFDRLLAKAHALDLKVMIDQVLSHTSAEHPWFRESRQSRGNPKSNWYVWADPREDGTPPNNWLSIFGGAAWQWEPRRQQYYLHNFLTEQPDLNFHNPDVRAAMLDNLRFWLERGVDGFRLDSINF